MTDHDIRPVEVHERRAALDAIRAALLSGPVDVAQFESGAGSFDDCDSLAAWDDDRCVGSAGAFRFDSTVPGGNRVTTAGVTRVGVLPTHTRRGLLTRMMHRLLTESRERGNVLATLHASETPIYRRFGFGLGSDAVAAVIRTRDATPWRTSSSPGSMRLLARTEILDTVPDVYDGAARWRPGSISRPRWWWERVLKEATEPASTPWGKGSFVAVHTGPDGDDGFVVYSVEWEEGFGITTGTGTVQDLWGASPAVELDLWRYVLGIDLVTTWKAELRPVDEPVRRAMHDSRAYDARQRADDQWVRILDVDGALEARTFGDSTAAAVVRVHDPMFAANCGAWRIAPHGAERTEDESDVEVDIAALSAAYLGGVSWFDLAASAQIAPSTPPATLARLDTLFAVQPAPFCGTFY